MRYGFGRQSKPASNAEGTAAGVSCDGILIDAPISLEIGRDVLNGLPLLNADALDQVTIHQITYDSGGIPVAGFVFVPRQSGPHPALIYNRGGYGDFGMLAPDLTFLQLAELSAEGYVVAASQYRGTAGFPGHDGFGGEDIDDVLSLFDVLEAMDNVDSSRIGMAGHSRGGLMTYLALARSDRIRTAVILAGPTDLVSGLRERPEMMRVYSRAFGDEGHGFEAALKVRSAVNLVEQFPTTTPILILHGTADWRVSPSDSLRIAELLLADRVPFRLVMLEGGDHGLSEYTHWRSRR